MGRGMSATAREGSGSGGDGAAAAAAEGGGVAVHAGVAVAEAAGLERLLHVQDLFQRRDREVCVSVSALVVGVMMLVDGL